jgi:hypothetical protein
MEILSGFDGIVDRKTLMEQLRIPDDSDDAMEFDKLLELAVKIANPKAIYTEGFVEAKTEDELIINGVKFKSRVLRKNFNKVEKVFPFIATCGTELDQVKFDKNDFLRDYWWDTIKGYFLMKARKNLLSFLEKRFFLKKTAVMSPGTGNYGIWHIEQQKELFSLIGDVEKLVGVKLTDSYLMIPNKSVSGILFSTEHDFNSCKVCRRENCPTRKSPFDGNLWKNLEIESGTMIKK